MSNIKNFGDPPLHREDTEDCAICLRPCLQPVKLPCKHIFCFLCAKGSAFQNRRCALCRSPIPHNFIKNPNEFKYSSSSKQENDTQQDKTKYAWFYQGYQGWWQYDERSSDEIEAAYQQQSPSVQILIAGHLYEIDFNLMQQYRADRSSRHRNIKRDKIEIDKKGIAGMATESSADSSNARANASASPTDANRPSTSATSMQTPAVETLRYIPVGEAVTDINPSTGQSQDDAMEADSDTEPQDSNEPALTRSMSSRMYHVAEVHEPALRRFNTDK